MPSPAVKVIEQRQYLGLNTLRAATEIPRFRAAVVLNADLSSSSQVGPAKGYTRFGNQANATDKITSLFTYERGLGMQAIPMSETCLRTAATVVEEGNSNP